MATINTGSHPKLLWPGVKTVWGQVYAAHEVEYLDLYETDTSDKAYETDVELTGFGLAQIKPEGQAGSYDTELQGTITNTVHIAYSLGYIVTYEELRDNQYAEVASRRSQANAFSVAQTIENIAAFPYNNAFATTFFSTADGAALCSTAHTLPGGGTWSNRLSTDADLTEASLEDMCIQIMGAQNNRGLQINIMPRSLHVPRQEWFNANRILQSALQSNSMSNNINVLKATNAMPGGVKVNHYFTDTDAWFVRTNCPGGMKLYWRERPDLAQDNDFDTKNAKALTYFRLSVNCVDPRGIFGTSGG